MVNLVQSVGLGEMGWMGTADNFKDSYKRLCRESTWFPGAHLVGELALAKLVLVGLIGQDLHTLPASTLRLGHFSDIVQLSNLFGMRTETTGEQRGR